MHILLTNITDPFIFGPINICEIKDYKGVLHASVLYYLGFY